MPEFVNKLSSAYEKRKEFLPPLFFGVGFLVDLVLSEGFDDVFTFVQHSLYLFLSWYLVLGEFHGRPQGANRISAFVLKYRSTILHFLLGSLLSAYFVLFYRSSSFLHSFFILAFFLVVLVANEFRAFQESGRWVKVFLATICLLCYSSVLSPLLFGHLGFIVFLSSLFVSLAFVWVFVKFFSQDVKFFALSQKRNFLWPVSFCFAGFFLAYTLKLTPPIPMAVKHIGIYHEVSRAELESDKRYRLNYYKDWWRLWNRSEEHFYKLPNSEIVCFFKVFSPAKFQETLSVRWLRKQNDAWVPQDKIFLPIQGGRKDGYRGFVKKKNFDAGQWRIRIESDDGRVMAQLDFTVENVDKVSAPLRVRYF